MSSSLVPNSKHQTDNNDYERVMTPKVHDLVKRVAYLYTAIADRTKKVEQATKFRTNLTENLQFQIKKLNEAKDLDTILAATADERIEFYVDHFDRYLEDAESGHDHPHDEIFGDEAFDDHLIEIGEGIERLRKSVLIEHSRNRDYDHTPNFGRVKSSMALAAVDTAMKSEGFETLIVGFQRKSITERLRARKLHRKWLKTGAGRTYKRKQIMRKKMHKRRDPKRVKLMHKVAQVYKHG